MPSFANLITKLAGALLVENVGRRKLFIKSSNGTCIFLYVLSASFYLENKGSPSARSLFKVGNVILTSVICVANSNCRFCTGKVGSDYLNGTCSEGSEDHSKFRTNWTKCMVREDYEVKHNFMNYRKWYYDHCPERKFAVMSLLALLMYVACFMLG